MLRRVLRSGSGSLGARASCPRRGRDALDPSGKRAENQAWTTGCVTSDSKCAPPNVVPPLHSSAFIYVHLRPSASICGYLFEAPFLAASGHDRGRLSLGIYQIVENALAHHQFLVRANLGYFARVEHHEAIRATQR